MWTIKPGDWLATCSPKGDFLTRNIHLFQKAQGHIPPAVYFTHSEVVMWATDAKVCVFSQTFPKAKYVYYKRVELEDKLYGGTRFLFRIQGYSKIVTDQFLVQLSLKADDIIANKPKGLFRHFPFNYDFLQLPNYWVNLVADKIGYKKHINWLEIPGSLGVCSDKAAEVLDAGFVATCGPSPIFLQRPNSEVTPADIWKEPMFYEVKEG